MGKVGLALLCCLSVAACASPQQTTGTAAGVVAGAVIAGPIGAVAGGAIGAYVTAPVSPGVCYRTDALGRVLYSRYGRPILVRC